MQESWGAWPQTAAMQPALIGALQAGLVSRLMSKNRTMEALKQPQLFR